MKFNLIYLILCCPLVVHCESDADDCPDPELIAPCHCDREGLSCYDQLTLEKLTSVFTVNTKYNAYRSIWIVQNEIKNLTANMFNGYRINHFMIEENQIETIEEGSFMGSYQTVTKISLYSNRISSFPFNELRLMTRLEKLGLASNRLTSIPANSFSLAKKLTTIDLSENQIEYIAPGTFFGMKSLALLSLAQNKLVQIPALTFSSITPRFKLDLSANAINFIDPSAFSNSIATIIALAGNQLTFLDPEIFERLVKGYTIMDVSDNPFTCRGCNNYKWLLSVEEKSIRGFQCSNGRSLQELNLINIGCFFA